MKRAWFRRIRGGGCQTLVMGEKPMCYHLVCLPPFLVSPNRFDVLMEVVGEVIVLGVGWQDCQSFSHTPTPPTIFHSLHSIPVSSPSRRRLLRLTQSSGRSCSHAEPWSVHSHLISDGLFVSSGGSVHLPHAEVGAVFLTHRQWFYRISRS